ncbi:hypothetical protein GYB22_09010 [bacterium]|nr:hypothetical protein [bacterium]
MAKQILRIFQQNSKLGVLTAVSLILSLLFLYQCSSNTDGVGQDYANHAPVVDYVGIDACAECHSDKVSTFIHTGMGMSFDHATKVKSSAEFKEQHIVYDSFLDYYYSPYWRRDSLFIKEFRLNDGDTTHQLEVFIDYIVGSGQHTNSHIYRNGNFLFQAPLTYYVQEGKWDLPPGYENGNNSRFNRILNVECLSCHNAMPKMLDESQFSFASVGSGIDCERCHGPGELHIKRAKEGTLDSEKVPSIVNPRNLSWERQIDVCQRCHLQGLNVLKEGKKFTDFRPGMDLSETFEIYLPLFEGNEENFDMANHAARFQRSECFIQNRDKEKPFTCISCHNPHVSVKYTQGSVYNAVCADCHTDKGCTELEETRTKVDNNCVTCHMPQQGTEDIPHVSVHDHYIRKPVKSEHKQEMSKLIGLYAVNNEDPDPYYKTKAYLEYFEKFDKNPFFLQQAGILLESNEFPILNIKYLYLKEDFATLVNYYNSNAPELDHWTAYMVGESMMRINKYEDGMQMFNLSYKMNTADPLVNRRYFILASRHGKFEEAGELEAEILSIYRYDPEVYEAAGILNIGLMNFKKAKEYLDYAYGLFPKDLGIWEAQLNLAIRTQDKQALKLWSQKILSKYPDHPNKEQIEALIQ